VSDLCGSDRAILCSYVFVQRCKLKCEDQKVQICAVEPGTQCVPKHVSPYVHVASVVWPGNKDDCSAGVICRSRSASGCFIDCVAVGVCGVGVGVGVGCGWGLTFCWYAAIHP
jgi:hypothetical protein